MSLTIIAEAGSCHEESLDRALRLTHVAAEAGATAVKWQYWSDPLMMRLRRLVTVEGAYTHGSIQPMWLPTLCDAAHAAGLKFVVTAYLPQDVPLLSGYVDAFKIASFEAMDQRLVEAVQQARGTRAVYISTGMCTQEEVDTLPLDCTRLHCVSAYPCPLDEANLGAIPHGGGYSDHTCDSETGGLAVAAGADVLEVHYRLYDTARDCPDYVVALSPSQLTAYVAFARRAYQARGSGHKVPQMAEADMLPHRVRG